MTVSSAGLLRQVERRVPDEGIALMRRFGIDLSEHLSQQIDQTRIDSADLILTMTRGQLRELVAISSTSWLKSFTLKDFIRRMECEPDIDIVGAPEIAFERLNVERRREELLSAADSNDVRDPMGQSLAIWTEVVSELVNYADRLSHVLASPRAVRRDLDSGRRARHRR